MSINTKERIADQFAKMAATRTIDKITVTDLMEECGISRQSFYYHFQDIFEVMEYRMNILLNDIISATLQKASPKTAIYLFVKRAPSTMQL